MVHRFKHKISQISLPEKFTYPFNYTPHPLCVAAAEEVKEFLSVQSQWHDEINRGKMFGVLVVKTMNSEIRYLAAFSGNLDGKNDIPFFVPPIYDMLKPNGFFKKEESKISDINEEIKEIQNSDIFIQASDILSSETRQAEKEINEAKDEAKKAKESRDDRRKAGVSEEESKAMIRESQFQKAEIHRLELRWKERLSDLKSKKDFYSVKIDKLKEERKERSAKLQQRLFEQFKILNARGEVRDLCDIFKDTSNKVPPSGAGECAAPKLLQYAYRKNLKPVCMAEFWWGESPRSEIRRHGFYYPSCRNKCEPILAHMLQGLEVDENPLEYETSNNAGLKIIYEDEYLIAIDKPAGMLSVPGKSKHVSIYGLLRKKYPEATGPIIVHRLDMATSGIMLAAKTKTVHQKLQAQFKNHAIKKRYIAILEGIVKQDEGIIDLPICPNPKERPLQMVSDKYGKPAITKYKVLERKNGKTLIAFYPQTGRTHQLRVHAAHRNGLNVPIVGDSLYGRPGSRMFLHAEHIEFCHPVTEKKISLDADADFKVEMERNLPTQNLSCSD